MHMSVSNKLGATMTDLYIFDTDSNNVIAVIKGYNKEQCLHYAQYKNWYPQSEVSVSFNQVGLKFDDTTHVVFLPENTLY